MLDYEGINDYDQQLFSIGEFWVQTVVDENRTTFTVTASKSYYGEHNKDLRVTGIIHRPAVEKGTDARPEHHKAAVRAFASFAGADREMLAKDGEENMTHLSKEEIRFAEMYSEQFMIDVTTEFGEEG